MKISIPLSPEELELLRLSFSMVEMRAETRMNENLPFFERTSIILDHAFAKGWHQKLQPGTISLTLKGKSEKRMFLRLIREIAQNVQSNVMADIARIDDQELRRRNLANIDREQTIVTGLLNRIEKAC